MYEHETARAKATEQLADILREVGIDCSTDGNSCDLDDFGIRVVCDAVTSDAKQQDLIRVQVKFALHVCPPNLTVRDSVSGIGDSREAALYQAMTALCNAFLLTSLAAFRGVPYEQCDVTKHIAMEGDLLGRFDTPKKLCLCQVFHSPVYLQGPPERRGELEQRVSQLEMIDHLTGTILPDEVEQANKILWFTLFAIREEGGSVAVDCRLNNESWPRAVDEMSRFMWPQVGNVQVILMFVVVIRNIETQHETESPLVMPGHPLWGISPSEPIELGILDVGDLPSIGEQYRRDVANSRAKLWRVVLSVSIPLLIGIGAGAGASAVYKLRGAAWGSLLPQMWGGIVGAIVGAVLTVMYLIQTAVDLFGSGGGWAKTPKDFDAILDPQSGTYKIVLAVAIGLAAVLATDGIPSRFPFDWAVFAISCTGAVGIAVVVFTVIARLSSREK